MDSDDLQVAETNATERVAFDLMEKIADKEALPKESPRRYYLELYSQCLYVVKTGAIPQDLKEHPLAPKKRRSRTASIARSAKRNKANSGSIPADAREADLPRPGGSH